MELLVIATLLLSLAAVAVALRRSISRARAQTTIHLVVDAAVAHRAFNENPEGLKNRPPGMFPVAAATGHGGQRNENVTSVKYGAHWRALRCNLTAESLHPSRIASLGPLQEEATQALVADLSARAQDAVGQAVEVRAHVRAAVYALAARQCFGDGLDPGLVRAMELAVTELAAAIGELNPVYDGTWLTQLVYWRPLRHLLGFLDRQTKLYIPLIEARRKVVRPPSHGDGDVRPYIDSLLDARVPSAGAGAGRRELRNDELVVLVAEFLGATNGSAVACLEWILAHLVIQPEIQNRLRREIDGGGELTVKSLRSMPYLNAMVLEALRMHPPIPILVRSAHGKAAKALGLTTPVPADGLRVMFDLGAIGRDSRAWKNPDEFRPERFLPGGEAEDVGPTPGRKEIRMMPFGAAHRVCPGITMGMMHIKWFLAALVREFEWAEDSAGGGVDLEEHNGFFKVMNKPLSARLTRRRT